MKKLIVSVVLASSLLFMQTGCGTTPVAKAVQGNSIIIYSVDSAMKMWSDYVNAGKATTVDIQRVKSAYMSYYNAQQINKAVIEKWLASQTATDSASYASDAALANTAVKNAETALINLINSILKI